MNKDEKEHLRMLQESVLVQVYDPKTRQVREQNIKRVNLIKKKVVFRDVEDHACVGIVIGFGEGGSLAVSQAEGKVPKEGTGLMVVL